MITDVINIIKNYYPCYPLISKDEIGTAYPTHLVAVFSNIVAQPSFDTITIGGTAYDLDKHKYYTTAILYGRKHLVQNWDASWGYKCEDVNVIRILINDGIIPSNLGISDTRIGDGYLQYILSSGNYPRHKRYTVIWERGSIDTYNILLSMDPTLSIDDTDIHGVFNSGDMTKCRWLIEKWIQLPNMFRGRYDMTPIEIDELWDCILYSLNMGIVNIGLELLGDDDIYEYVDEHLDKILDDRCNKYGAPIDLLKWYDELGFDVRCLLIGVILADATESMNWILNNTDIRGLDITEDSDLLCFESSKDREVIKALFNHGVIIYSKPLGEELRHYDPELHDMINKKD